MWDRFLWNHCQTFFQEGGWPEAVETPVAVAAVGSAALKGNKVGALWGYARVQVQYDTHLPTLSLHYGEKS